MKRFNELAKAGMIIGLALVMTAPVFAQRPGGPRGGDRGFGPPPDGGPPGGGRGPEIAREDMEAAWQLEAAHAATKAGLSESQTTQLAQVYADARRVQGQGMRDGARDRGPRGGDRDRGQGREDFRERRQQRDAQRDVARAQFVRETGKFLTGQRLNEVLRRLGTFNPQYDGMVHTLRGFNLAGNQSAAIEAANMFAIETHGLMESARTNNDFESVRGQLESKRQALDSTIAGLVSDTQFRHWQEATQMRRGGPGGGRGQYGNRPPGGPGQGQGRGGPPPQGGRPGGTPPQR